MKSAIGIAAVAAFVVLAIAVSVIGFKESPKEWLKPQPIFTLAGLLVGFLVLRWQLAVQHANTLRANADKDRNVLNLEIYRDVSSVSEDADRAVMRLFELTLAADAAWALGGIAPQRIEPPTATALVEAANGCTDAMVAVLARVQKWEIAFAGGQAKFADALKESLGEVRGTTTKLISAMRARVSGDDISALREDVVRVRYAILGLTTLLWDLRVESQNVLLGDLFHYRVPRRQPTDPRLKVTTLTP